MDRSSNLKYRAAPILFALLLAAGALQAQQAKKAGDAALPAALDPAARQPASSLGLKVSGEWKIEGDAEEGGPKTLGELLGKGRAAVLIFLSARDPATLACAERIGKLGDDYLKKSVTIIGVGVGRNETFQELKAVDEQYDWNFPVVQDADLAIARGLKARFTPQVMLIDSAGRVRYSGPIDDCWFDARKAKDPLARNALDAFLSGKKISTPEPDTYGGESIR